MAGLGHGRLSASMLDEAQAAAAAAAAAVMRDAGLPLSATSGTCEHQLGSTLAAANICTVHVHLVDALRMQSISPQCLLARSAPDPSSYTTANVHTYMLQWSARAMPDSAGCWCGWQQMPCAPRLTCASLSPPAPESRVSRISRPPRCSCRQGTSRSPPLSLLGPYSCVPAGYPGGQPRQSCRHLPASATKYCQLPGKASAIDNCPLAPCSSPASPPPHRRALQLAIHAASSRLLVPRRRPPATPPRLSIDTAVQRPSPACFYTCILLTIPSDPVVTAPVLQG